jgi:hypothetical protein
MWKELSITHLTTSADRELLTFRKTLLFETSTTQIEDHRFKSLSAYNSHDDYRDVFLSMAYLGLNAPSQDPNRHLHRQNTSHDIAQAAAQHAPQSLSLVLKCSKAVRMQYLRVCRVQFRPRGKVFAQYV